jgi:hypothetical protein
VLVLLPLFPLELCAQSFGLLRVTCHVEGPRTIHSYSNLAIAQLPSYTCWGREYR